MVVEPSQESMELAKKITEMGESIDKNVRYLLNKVDDQTEQIISKSIEKSKTLASIPQDGRIFTYGLEGKELGFEVEGIGKTVNYLTEKIIKKGRASRSSFLLNLKQNLFCKQSFKPIQRNFFGLNWNLHPIGKFKHPLRRPLNVALVEAYTVQKEGLVMSGKCLIGLGRIPILKDGLPVFKPPGSKQIDFFPAGPATKKAES